MHIGGALAAVGLTSLLELATLARATSTAR